MKAGLWPTCEALIISCVLLYSSAVEARHMRFNPSSIRPPQHPIHPNRKEVGSHFRDTHMRKSGTMMNDEIPVVPVENKLRSPLRETLHGSIGLNHSRGIKEAETVARGAQMFSKRPSDSKKGSARMKKDVEVMAFRPTSSGHSPGVGHGNPPDHMV